MFTAYNRSFSTYDEAYNYCISCDFDTAFIIKQVQTKQPILYWYEMIFRPLSIGCQPKGYIKYDDTKGRNGIISYDRPLTDEEINDYELRDWTF